MVRSRTLPTLASTVALACATACFEDSTDGGASASATGTDSLTDGGTDSATGSATDTATTDSETTGTATTTDTGSEMACAEYCDVIADHCVDGDSQYTTSSVCQAVCAGFPAGMRGDVDGNSVACRTYHAIAAVEMPDFHCPHAGPTGGDLCGGLCQSFCHLAMQFCTGENEVWSNTEACATDCATFAKAPPYSAMVSDGDTYGCRMWHLAVASLQPETHCPHIGLDSPVCL